MLRYVIRRILLAIPTLLGVAFLTFVLFYATSSPEQIARRNLSAKNPTPQQIKAWLHQHGYDKPKWVQFKETTEALFLLRFGKSDATGENIWTRIKEGAGPSFEVQIVVLMASLTVSICFALGLAYFRATYLDYWGAFLCVLLMSITALVYIMTGQFIFGKLLRWFPLAGYRHGFDSLRFILLPVLVALISGVGGTTRLFRTFMLDAMNQDYVRTARAKGVSETRVLFKHVLKNAAIPIASSVVASIPGLFLGSLLLESFFDIPGLGSYTVDAINGQDFAVVRAMVFLGALVTIVGYILTDICYALLDPRVRLE
ncbi:ABC transporter permease [Chthonomonas calidirosea]|uniref:ABC-type dipeptide/oligopeptide/nickel transport systems, permease components n=1 Tax=Chthonomonas calidirosea (strain DSM 23976 / ICMP 18418 / T49) TaxID=1303518 RepID=S0EX44_CHTCT|nr:ABC transporter permease [Chthonomonas calidirosea]CCW34866.1 ABC-type dipeptide/oligopeptide/nickel transport systems, permease components [Chthonomonas calidirosea T49]CEK12609.1 ABC-type dipeptide/oligopeptide/nickel transport system, permease component [Chthonomonas calidirosea]CEK13571.1 ABC-type dipeptide/oligopeptide/nickel transport system, permease component [Chthonomonas calidirosea]